MIQNNLTKKGMHGIKCWIPETFNPKLDLKKDNAWLNKNVTKKLQIQEATFFWCKQTFFMFLSCKKDTHTWFICQHVGHFSSNSRFVSKFKCQMWSKNVKKQKQSDFDFDFAVLLKVLAWLKQMFFHKAQNALWFVKRLGKSLRYFL